MISCGRPPQSRVELVHDSVVGNLPAVHFSFDDEYTFAFFVARRIQAAWQSRQVSSMRRRGPKLIGIIKFDHRVEFGSIFDVQIR